MYPGAQRFGITRSAGQRPQRFRQVHVILVPNAILSPNPLGAAQVVFLAGRSVQGTETGPVGQACLSALLGPLSVAYFPSRLVKQRDGRDKVRSVACIGRDKRKAFQHQVAGLHGGVNGGRTVGDGVVGKKAAQILAVGDELCLTPASASRSRSQIAVAALCLHQTQSDHFLLCAECGGTAVYGTSREEPQPGASRSGRRGMPR